MAVSFGFVLHSHLPYVRGAGRWPHGEEWVHEAILGTYLPMLVALHDLRDQRVRFRLTIGLTPPLLEQLADPEVNARFVEYVDDQVRRADVDANVLAESGDAARALLAAAYRDRFARLRSAYLERFGRDLVGAFASLARSGELEILSSAATHGYLPLLDDASVESQLAVGLATTRRLLRLETRGFWLPECAYRPGLERALERQGIGYVMVDPALVAGRREGAPGAGAWRESRRSGGALANPRPARAPDERGAADPVVPHFIRDSRVVAVARHANISGQVWSADFGYPGDPAYREFHKKDARSGMRYWRVTGREVDLGEKAPYSADAASRRVRSHAEHFVQAVREAAERRERPGLLVAAFDSELFGHWWFEGIDWLAEVMRLFAGASVLNVTVSEYLAAHPPTTSVALAEGSWGKDNDHSTWVDPRTEWMHAEVTAMVRALEELAAAFPAAADPLRERAARQAVRELLLAEASDWPFLVTTGQAADYAGERFRQHEERFRRALQLARAGSVADEAELRALEHADAVFPSASVEPFARAGRVTA